MQIQPELLLPQNGDDGHFSLILKLNLAKDCYEVVQWFMTYLWRIVHFVNKRGETQAGCFQHNQKQADKMGQKFNTSLAKIKQNFLPRNLPKS